MTYELYVADQKITKSKISTAQQKRSLLLKQLDLDGQGKLDDTQRKSAGLTIKPMSADEVVVWKAFLPTAYRSRGSLNNYEFDRIPTPVLEQWNKLKGQNTFDAFEIWTPETQTTDPALIGCIGQNRYMIARWAESDANLLTLHDVARKVRFKSQSISNTLTLSLMIWLFTSLGAGIGSQFIPLSDKFMVLLIILSLPAIYIVVACITEPHIAAARRILKMKVATP